MPFPLKIMMATVELLELVGQKREAQGAAAIFFDGVESLTAFTLASKGLPVHLIPSKMN